MDENQPLMVKLGSPVSRYDSSASSTCSRNPYPSPTELPEVHLSAENLSFMINSPEEEDDDDDQPSLPQLRDELSLLDPYFDMTRTRMEMIFNAIDTNRDGIISYRSFRDGLDQLGIKCKDDGAFEKFIKTIDQNNTQGITCEQFQLAVQRLKLIDLFQPETMQLVNENGQSEPITLVEYNDKHIRRSRYTSESEVRRFFNFDATKTKTVRWICVNGRDQLNIKRLAIKFRLHPLSIEDTLELHERPKFDHYDTHLFIVFPVLRINETLHECPARVTLRQRSGSIKQHMHLHHEAINTSKKKFYDEEFSLEIDHIAIFVVGEHTIITVSDGDVGSHHIWDDINRRLDAPYSKLRHNDGKFLLYTVIDVVVDRISFVMDELTHHLIHLEEELEVRQHKFQMGKLRLVKNELFKLPRLLKPAREVLKNLIDSKDINDDTTAYFRDVHDHVVQILDDIELQLQMCRLLAEEYRETKANQMNYVIYTLTIVTTVFLPAQFLTGVYGMNFDNMPELHLRYGYALFWVFVIGIAVCLQLYFRYKRWIE